jgi:hypothetical protein
MFILTKATLAEGLTGTKMAASLALAAVDGVPTFDVEPSCRAAARDIRQLHDKGHPGNTGNAVK